MRASDFLGGNTCICQNCGAVVLIPSDFTESDSPPQRTPDIDLNPKLAYAKDIVEKVYDEKYPRLSQSIWLILLYFITTYAVMLLISIFTDNSDGGSTIHPLPKILILAITFIIILIYVSRKTGKSARKILSLKIAGFNLIVPVLISSIGINFFFLSLGTYIIILFPGSAEQINSMGPNIFKSFEINIWGAFLNTAIIVPFIEECLFRGIILRGYLKNYSIKKSVIISALIFGIYHLNPIQFVSATTWGIFSALIYVKTRSILPCFICHSINNGLLVVIGLTLISNVTVEPDWAPSILAVIIISIFSLVITSFGIWLFVSKLRESQNILSTGQIT
ncbi:MAG: CPBP family intramembrane metalloprotease [candidate division Zixibacteria bacterium]|nr:CPBP family intramembrane metalloprotease [candidate division Zixibacteria bacterium]